MPQAPSRWPAAAVAALECPVCRGALEESGAGLACRAGHRFDAARQGYVHLAATPIRHTGDTIEMVAARERVQSAGMFDGLTDVIVAAVPAGASVVLDLGAGTGHHLAAVLQGGDDGPTVGIAVDTSKPALRRAARAHPRLLAVASDVTERLPLADGAVDVAMITFAPRAAAELGRVVASRGVLLVAVPTPDHLAEIRAPLGMLAVPDGKDDRLREALGAAFQRVDCLDVRTVIPVDRATATDLALMGPAGFHTTVAERAARSARLPDSTDVTVAVVVQVHRRK